MRIGIHTSISKSLENAALEAARLGANTFQIFSASPRMWRATCPDSPACRAMQKARVKHDLSPLVIHDNYLINLGSANETIRAQSIAAFRGELERAVAIDAEYLVAHPGNYKGQSLEQGLIAVVQGLAEAARGIKSKKLGILLENTVGAGAQIGGRFEELAVIRQLAQEQVSLRIGFCLDTCHCLASGYDIASAAGLREMVSTADAMLGLANVPVIHTNDSKSPLGSHIDRHQNIGEGYIGMEGFSRILNHPKLRDKAFILETPVDKEGDDRRNLDTLKSLCRKSRTSTKKSS